MEHCIFSDKKNLASQQTAEMRKMLNSIKILKVDIENLLALNPIKLTDTAAIKELKNMQNFVEKVFKNYALAINNDVNN